MNDIIYEYNSSFKEVKSIIVDLVKEYELPKESKDNIWDFLESNSLWEIICKNYRFDIIDSIRNAHNNAYNE